MSAIARAPLGASTRQNRVIEMKTKDDPDTQMQVAKLEVKDQRRRRAEAEGMAEAAKRDSAVAKETIARLRKELEAAQAPASQHHRTGGDKQSEAKLEDLVRRYQSSKMKHQAEVDTLRATNKELQSSLEAHTEASDSIADLRKSHALAEAEKLRLKGEIEALKGKAGQEKRELERVNAENETMRQKAKEADTIEARTGRLQEMLETSARAFQQLYYASVPRAEYERLQEEALSTRMSLRPMEDRASRFGMQVALAKEERQELRQRLKLSEDQRAMAEQIIEDLQEQRRALRDRSTVNPTFVDDNVSLDASPSRSQSLQLVDLALANSALHSSHLQRQLRGVSERHDDLLSSLSATSSTLSNTHGELSKIRSQHLHLQSLHTALEANHTPCAGLIINLQNDLTHCSTSQQGAQRSMEETKVELRRVEQKARTDREALKRANDGAMRWRSAETALEEEIATLKDAVDDARRYEELYNELLGSYKLLRSREALAIEDAEKMAAQNAELIGAGPGVQRISYVDAVRREMALVKQELASTRMMLNTANDRIRDLSDEVAAYKTVDDGLGASTRTRVVRRQPEGSGVLRTSRSTGGLRSVSGPVRRT